MAKDLFPRKLFNKGARVITFERGDFLPQKSASFTDAEAEKLLRLYRNEIIDMDNVTAETLVSSDVNAALEEKGRAFDEAIEKRFAEAKKQKQEKAYAEAIKAKFSEDEAREIAGMEKASDEKPKA